MKKIYHSFRVFTAGVALFIMPFASAAIDARLNYYIEIVVVGELQEGMNSSEFGRELGEKICATGGGLFCINSTIGEGICKSGGGQFCSGSTIGEGICKAGGGQFCSGSTIGEGICKAGRGQFCSGSTIGEGICKAGAGQFCSGSTVAEGLCKARDGQFCSNISIEKALALPIVDKEWAWDMFYQANAEGMVWACRGMSTGQFADTYKCSTKPKIDLTWPNN